MCLAIPGKVKEINGHQVMVAYPNEDRKVLVGDDQIKIGDFVLVQMGVIVRTISKKEQEVASSAWKSNT